MKFKNREEYNKKKFYFLKDDCPFCTKLDANRIIFESEYWFVTPNNNPYFEDENWLMAIPKRHMAFTIDLNKQELIDFIEVEKFMNNYYKDKWEYFSFIRQSKSNKSVEHMHYHYLVWIPGTTYMNWENVIKIKDWYK